MWMEINLRTFVKILYFCLCVTIVCCINSFAQPDDLKQLNDKCVEVNTSKLALQLKLDELEAAEVNIKVSYAIVFT